MRVLTTWLRWGVLYRFPMGINSFHLPPFCGRFFKYFLVGFSSGTSRIAGFGEGTPQQDLPKGQNRRYADFGTVVESCSKKLPLSSAALVCGFTGLLHQYSDCGGVFCPLFPSTEKKNFCQLYGRHFVKYLPSLPSTRGKAKWTEIFRCFLISFPFSLGNTGFFRKRRMKQEFFSGLLRVGNAEKAIPATARRKKAGNL